MYLAQIGIDGQESAPADTFEPVTPPIDLLEPEILQLERWMLGPMVGRSLVMQHLFSRMKCTAPHFRLATIEGEPGVGKLLTAQTLHHIGPSAGGPFVPHIAAEFLDDPVALWKEARDGLLYLSRIDELPREKQAPLRDFLERAVHERLRTRSATGPLQFVVGSSQPLRRLATTGSFRPDLATHLTAIRFAVPPLHQRKDDIPLLAGLFLRQWSQLHQKPLRGFAPGVFPRLAAYSWPGNVRELESVIAAAALECSGQWIRPIDIPRLQWPAPAVPLPSPDLGPSELPPDDPNLDRAILRHIIHVLAQANGNKVRAARMLGISRSTLYRLLESSTSVGHRPAS